MKPMEKYKAQLTSIANLENMASAGSVHTLNPATWLSAVRPDNSQPGYDQSLGGYRVDVSKTQLEGAPKYEREDDAYWTEENGRRVYDYYGVTPYWI